MSSKWDSRVSAEAWDRVVSDFRLLDEDERADDAEVAELLRNAIYEVEGGAA